MQEEFDNNTESNSNMDETHIQAEENTMQYSEEEGNRQDNISDNIPNDRRKRINRLKTIIVAVVILFILLPTFFMIILGIQVNRLQKQVNELLLLHGKELSSNSFLDETYAYAAEIASSNQKVADEQFFLTQSNEIQSNEIQSNELQSKELQSNELQSKELQSNELQSNELQSNELQSKELQSKELQSNEIKKTEILNLDIPEIETQNPETQNTSNTTITYKTIQDDNSSSDILSNDILKTDTSNTVLPSSQNNEEQKNANKKTGIYSGKKVYLTFDDGPSIYTDDILDILKEYKIKATFFVIGRTDQRSKKLYRRIVDEGHTLGMHSYSHIYSYIYNSVENFDKDFTKLWKLLYDTTGYKPTIYRFPGGSSNKVNKNGMTELIDYLNNKSIIYYDWNVLSGDATGIKYTNEQLVDNVLNGITKKEISIVLMHDAKSKAATIETLPELLDKIISGGASILPIDENVPPIQQIKANSVNY